MSKANYTRRKVKEWSVSYKIHLSIEIKTKIEIREKVRKAK